MARDQFPRNVFASRVHEALIGRMDTIVLWPLAQTEMKGTETNIIDLLFAGHAPDVQGAPVGRAAFASIAVARRVRDREPRVGLDAVSIHSDVRWDGP